MTSSIGITCRRLAKPLPGSGTSSVLRISNLLSKLLEFPF